MESTSPCKSCYRPASRLKMMRRFDAGAELMEWLLHFKAYWALHLKITGRFRASHDQELLDRLGRLEQLHQGGSLVWDLFTYDY